MNIKEAFTTTLNLHWARTACEEEHWRIAEIWMGALGPQSPVGHIEASTLANTAVAWLEAGLSPSTVNRRVAVLSKALHTAKDLGHLDTVPKLPRLKEPAPIDRALSHDQLAALIAACGPVTAQAPKGVHGFFMIALIQFLANTGARLGEAMAASWEDMVDGRWTIRHSKNGSSRVVPLNSGARDALELCGTDLVGTADSPLPFGSFATQAQVQHWWRKVREAAGLPHARLHDLRHSCASNLVRKGVSLYTVGHLLGHKNFKTTQRYAHIDTKAVEEAVNLL